MRFQTELCHITDRTAVVRANGWDEDSYIGSALGEASTAEEAENRAIERLVQRVINNHTDHPSTQLESKQSKKSVTKEHKNIEGQIEVSENKTLQQKNKDDSSSFDWTEELLLLDIELKRLNWDKKQEANYLKKLYGYNSRNKITEVSKLQIMVELLKHIASGSKAEDIDTNDILMAESNVIIERLGWDNTKARIFLKELLGANSRQELSLEELRSFTKELKKLLP